MILFPVVKTIFSALLASKWVVHTTSELLFAKTWKQSFFSSSKPIFLFSTMKQYYFSKLFPKSLASVQDI